MPSETEILRAYFNYCKGNPLACTCDLCIEYFVKECIPPCMMQESFPGHWIERWFSSKFFDKALDDAYGWVKFL